MTLPERFISLMQEQLGDEEAAALVASLGEEPSTSIRLNPCKMTSPRWAAKPVAWSVEGYSLDDRPSFTLDSDFHAGTYYVQEASSQFAGYIVQQACGGKEGCRGLKVLDVCAAPGGKSTHYASLVGQEGVVVANEINHSRAAVLADNARKWGLGNMIITCNDSSRLAEVAEWFDVVAVDAPCSGEGMFRKSDDATEQWSEANVMMCAERQWEILENAFEALACGGLLIYSTCTFNHFEDEDILLKAMEHWGEELCEAEPIAVSEDWNVVCGRVGVFQTFRFFPHRVKGEGMFMAVARKAEESSARAMPKPKRRVITPVDRSQAKELSRWVADAEEKKFFTAGEMIYACRASHYPIIESFSGVLSVIYSGVAMGQIFKGALKPDGALAFYVDLSREAVPAVEVSEDVALQFLRRQDISAEPFEQGINLVVCRGRALGFVKRIGARVNNLYPQSLRILH